MKIPALSLLAIPCLAIPVGAAEKAAVPAAPAAEAAAPKPDDLSAFKTADALWAHVQDLQKEPEVRPKSREEMITLVTDWFTKQRAAADAFVKTYPKDERRWQAKMIGLQAGLQLAQIPGAPGDAKTNAGDVLKEIDAVLAAEDAPADAKGEASFVKTMMATESVDPERPETVANFFKLSEDFLAKYGDHKLAPQMRQTQMQLASEATTPEAEALLKRYAEGKDEQLAGAAKEILGQHQKMKDLKTKPVALKFTATDGKEVDIEKLRGKVVLVDFWASWCGPCMAEAPNVVATYAKLHDKGFEILGISLDQEKEAMEGALKKQGMTWTQYFDGKGWQNTISTSFGINSIPAAWLIDKKGMLRETSLRGEALGAGVEKLLAE